MANTQEIYERAKGCLLGALVGDAAGATLEFLNHDPTPKEVEWAMSMPGGGALAVAPGQITDDGELTLCLAQALAESKIFNLEKIARNYAQWVESDPFDIGFTTSASLGSYSRYEWQDTFKQEGYAGVMTKAAAARCYGSKANGSLMRITPLGIWGHQLEDEQLANYAIQDSRLSHPNPSCCYAVACYAIALASSIKYKGERNKAFDNAKNWLKTQANLGQNELEQNSRTEVSNWLQDIENNVTVPYSPQIGFIKIAFTHAFRHLLGGSDYVTAIEETLAGGGDTDTNACIVGGLIGAACGVEAIPESMISAVLNSNTKQGENPRPSFLHPSQVPLLIENLLKEIEQ